MSASGTKITVRDARRKGWFSIDNELFRGGWAVAMGTRCVVVYCAIAMHVDNETQKAIPSYDTLQKLCGLGRSTVVKAVQELQDWNIIHIRPRRSWRGQISHEYTLLDKSVWKTEAQIRNGRDKATGEVQYITKKVKPYTPRGSSSDVAEDFEEEQDAELDGSLDEPGLVHQVDGGGTDDERGGSQHVDGGGSQGEPEQYSGNKTYLNETKEQHDGEQNGVVVGSLSSWTKILSKRQLSAQEEHRFQQQLVLHLMQSAAADFNGVNAYVEKLSRERTRRAGAALMLMYSTSVKQGTLKSPAAFLRSKIECAEEDVPGLDGLLITWLTLVEQVKEAAKCRGANYSLGQWLVGRNLKDSLQDALESYGITFEFDYTDPNLPWNS